MTEPSAADLLERPSGFMPDLIRDHARRRPERIAVMMDGRGVDYRAFDRIVDRIAASLQRDGVLPGEAVSISAATGLRYAALYIGVLRAGAAVAPIAPSVTGEQMAAMIADSGARLAFLDDGTAATPGTHGDRLTAQIIAIDDGGAGLAWSDWLAGEDATPAHVDPDPDLPFNIIYSSGTTGVPKGIVHSHRMRWRQIAGTKPVGYDEAVLINSTPLYSNTTLVTFLPALAWGGTVVLMKKFEARRFLELAAEVRATHAMLVPVQYARIMAEPDFGRFDLSSFRYKTCTSAPFAADLKRDVLDRWPGKLLEYYGLTEGGCSFALVADEHPDKLHTVGRPLPGHEVKLIGEDGIEVAPGEAGEIVGRSGTMMDGYLGRIDKTAEMIWTDADGQRWFRQGDIGRLDEDGFLILTDRKKDMIISGGFNVFPSDIEAVVRTCPGVEDVSVVGVPSDRWGETPVAFVVGTADGETVMAFTNDRVGKTQRLSDVVGIEELPRSAIGKVLKRDLRDRYATYATYATSQA